MNGLDIIKARAFGADGGSGGGVKVTPLTVTENGTYTAESGTAYSPVTVNVAAQGGSDTEALIDRSITEVKSDATSIGSYAFYNCKKLTTAYFPSAESVKDYAFQGCTTLTTADFSSKTTFGMLVFYGCTMLATLVLRSSSRCTLGNTNAFTGTPLTSGAGYIYVPSALINTYKAATNWSTFAAQFRALEDYTVDGTITGELDPEKIGA